MDKFKDCIANQGAGRAYRSPVLWGFNASPHRASYSVITVLRLANRQTKHYWRGMMQETANVGDLIASKLPPVRSSLPSCFLGCV